MTDNPKDQIGRTKPNLSAVPLPPLFEVGAVMELGATKYGRHNYRVSPIAYSVYFDAALRHLFKFFEGEDLDPEIGASHLAHAVAGLLLLRDAMMRGVAVDDRPPLTEAGWIEEMAPLFEAARAARDEPAAPFTQAGVAANGGE